MGPRALNQPSAWVRGAGLGLVLLMLLAIYYLMGDSEVADNIEGTDFHKKHPTAVPIVINQPSAKPLISYHCQPAGNLTFVPTSAPLMGLPWPPPKHFHQHDKSMSMRLNLASTYSIVLDFNRQAVEPRVKELINVASQRFCVEQQAHSEAAQKEAYFHTIDTVKIIISASIMEDIVASSDLSQNLWILTGHVDAYALLLKEDGRVVLVASTERGAMNGLSTLSQLLHSPMPLQTPAEIIDWPDRDWRGLLVDVSRHFIPLPTLRIIVDGMRAHKLNTLHLHLTDAQAFPVLLNDTLRSVDLTQFVTPAQRAAGKYYTLAELAALVAFARERGVDVVPEVDMPAHTLSWGNALQDFLVQCHGAAGRAENPANIYALDVTRESLYEVIAEILRQVSATFPSKYLHVGGDEVDDRCWLESERITAFMAQHNITRLGEVTKYFETRVFAMVYALGRIPMVWQGIVDTESMPDYAPLANVSAVEVGAQGVATPLRALSDSPLVTRRRLEVRDSDKKAVVMPWKCWGGLASRAADTALGMGHPLVVSACWYLDYNSDWLSFFNPNPVFMQHPAAGDNASRAEILGAEASIWTENVDATSIQCRVFPRLGAIAARLWGIDHSLCVGSYLHNNSKLHGTYDTHLPETLAAVHGELSTPTSCHLRPLGGSLRLNAASTKLLYSAYLVFAQYLSTSVGLQLDRVVFHLAHPRKRVYVPYYPTSLQNSLTIVDAMTQGVTIPSTGRMVAAPNASAQLTDPQAPGAGFSRNHDLLPGRHFSSKYHVYAPDDPKSLPLADLLINPIYITCACWSLPEYLDRPLTTTEVKIAQWNIADGGDILMPSASRGYLRASLLVQLNKTYSAVSYTRNESQSAPPRFALIQAHLSSLADQGYLFVGLNELVSWDSVSAQPSAGVYRNLMNIYGRAAECGFAHHHITSKEEFGGYPLGILSALPFDVVREVGTPVFERGFLHVLQRALRLHVFVVHLHAHSSSSRVSEVTWLLQHELTPLIEAGERVVVMGDFNTFSPVDRLEHERAQLLQTIRARDHPMLTMWRRKFLTENEQEIDYRPMHLLLNAGLRDVCVDRCCLESRVDVCENMQWARGHVHHNASDADATRTEYASKQDMFSQCMAAQCSHSAPTRFSPEWPFDDLPQPRVRIDFMLASPAVYSQARGSSPVMTAGVHDLNITHEASDHYPMYLHFPVPGGQPLALHSP